MKKISIPFATTNKNKIREIEEVLGYEIEVIDNLDVPELQCKNFTYEDVLFVAGEKARAAYYENKCQPVIVEDSALCIEALEGRPGPLVDQFAGTLTARQALCRSLPTTGSRATAYCTLAIFDGKDLHFRVGTIEGSIAEKPRGTNGFGWDDIFIPKQAEDDAKMLTFAEMSAKEKNAISMRKRAVEALKKDPFSF